MNDTNKLFDIFCEDRKQRRELEEEHMLQMTEDSFKFYDDQKGPRKAECLSAIDT